MSPRTFIVIASGLTLVLFLGSALAPSRRRPPDGPRATGRGAAARAATVPATIDEIVARNLQARGGLERLRAVQAITMKGLMQAANGTDLPTTLYMQRPNRIRQEVTVNGRLAIQAFDGERGWAQNPMMGNAPVEVPSRRRQADGRAGRLRRPARRCRVQGPQAGTAGHRAGRRGDGVEGEADQEGRRRADPVLRQRDGPADQDAGRDGAGRPEDHDREPLLRLPDGRRPDACRSASRSWSTGRRNRRSRCPASSSRPRWTTSSSVCRVDRGTI